MLVNEILMASFAVAGKDFLQWPEKNMAIAWLNICANEALPYENNMRAAKKLPLIKDMFIKSLNDDIPFSEIICQVALPYGIATFIYADLQDNHTSQVYRNRFIVALQDADMGIETTIEDYYA